jgi:hypothetical protein
MREARIQLESELVARSGVAKQFAESLLANTAARQGYSSGALLALPQAGSSSIPAELHNWLLSIAPNRARILSAWINANEATEVTRQLSFDSLLEWDPSKHPRRGGPPNAGWFASGGVSGSGGGTASSKPSVLDGIINRNRQIADLTGGPTSGIKASSKLAREIQNAGRLVSATAKGFASGLKTGGKAVVNGSATAIKNVATLGLSSGQLELLGVTDEDRANGYDTAVTIATASGELLIAVGTGGVASALSKGGTVARGASGALLAYDAAGNAVGVVQGSYDAATNGVDIRNGSQIAAGALGLTANARAAADIAKPNAPRKSLTPEPSAAEVYEFVQTLPRKNTPTSSPANQYEIKHTGPHNYTVSGGGEAFAIDGYDGAAILEAKHVGDPISSPYVPGSKCFEPVRKEVLDEVRDELRRVKLIHEDRGNPFQSIEIITNYPAAKELFEEMLQEASLTGRVRLEP